MKFDNSKMQNSVQQIWKDLKTENEDYSGPQKRVYRRLDLKRESGIRAGLILPDQIREILIETDISSDGIGTGNPMWKGMQLEKIVLNTPKENSEHIRFSVKSKTHEVVFNHVISDLLTNLERCKSIEERNSEINSFLSRWSHFFSTVGPDGLSLNYQRGLYGELTWLKKLMEKGLDKDAAVNAWKGCRRAFHDFEFYGVSVEVKTTLSKEPRKVWINNERQLDDSLAEDLFLFVLSLQEMLDQGQSLVELVDEIRSVVECNSKAVSEFELSLQAAGFIDAHREKYYRKYVTAKEELFEIRGDFPRLTQIPQGTGDLKYSLTLSSCKDFILSEPIFFKKFLLRENTKESESNNN